MLAAFDTRRAVPVLIVLCHPSSVYLFLNSKLPPVERWRLVLRGVWGVCLCVFSVELRNNRPSKLFCVKRSGGVTG
eukprot:3817232-Prymnesium_polylepis.1